MLLALLSQLWVLRKQTLVPLTLLLAVFLQVTVVLNIWIAAMGMGVKFGWPERTFLAIAISNVIAYFFVDLPLREAA